MFPTISPRSGRPCLAYAVCLAIDGVEMLGVIPDEAVDDLTSKMSTQYI